MKFRIKPKIVTAIQWDGTHETRKKIRDVCPANIDERVGLQVELSHLGWTTIEQGEWLVIIDDEQCVMAMDDEEFRATYEPVIEDIQA